MRETVVLKKKRGRPPGAKNKRTKVMEALKAQQATPVVDPAGIIPAIDPELMSQAQDDKTLTEQLKADSRYRADMTTAQQRDLMRARRDAVIAAVAEMTLRERSGRLIMKDLVVAHIEEMNIVVRDELHRLANRLAHALVGLSAEKIEAALNKEILSILEKLPGNIAVQTGRSTSHTHTTKLPNLQRAPV